MGRGLGCFEKQTIFMEVMESRDKVDHEIWGGTSRQHRKDVQKLFYRLDDVQNRLKETNDEFESMRRKARKSKIEFEAVQKERLVVISSESEYSLFGVWKRLRQI